MVAASMSGIAVGLAQLFGVGAAAIVRYQVNPRGLNISSPFVAEMTIQSWRAPPYT
jgi:hypothetical protein